MEQTLGKRIIFHRKRLGLTQDQLAEQLGVTAQAVSKWENDLSCPDIAMLPKLSSLFGISIDTLLGSEPEPEVHEGEVVEEASEEPGIHVQKGNWEFHMDTGRRSTLGFALAVLLTGAQLLVSRALNTELSFWSALWPAALIGLGVTGVFFKFSFFNLGCALFGLYFALENWELLPFSLGSGIVLPVILVLFGLSLIVDAMKKPKKPHFKMNHSGHPKNDLQYTPEGFAFSASFGETTQYISLEKLSSGSISTSFGDFTIDLSGVQQVSKHCSLEANCSFGELTIRVPSKFAVMQSNSGAFSDASTSGHADSEPEGTIYLDSHVSFGEIHVEYI